MVKETAVPMVASALHFPVPGKKNPETLIPPTQNAQNLPRANPKGRQTLPVLGDLLIDALQLLRVGR